MAKVICESCGSSFPLERVKELKNCPVCGETLWDEQTGNDNENNSGIEGGLMYFDEIVEFNDEPEYSHVSVYCGECKAFNDLALDKFDKLLDKKYVMLKDGVTIICRECGKEHKPRKILYKKKDDYAPPLPRCPLCNSAMLKKITAGSKVLAAASIGVFALPYNSKTFECKDCGYRF